MKSQIDRAIRGAPYKGPFQPEEQRQEWRRALQEELDLEKMDIRCLKSDISYLLAHDDFLTRYNEWEHALKRNSNFTGYMFFEMHLVAYIDDLLGGTGISKEAIETPP